MSPVDGSQDSRGCVRVPQLHDAASRGPEDSQMEARGEFTIEGCIEMAWMMGFIKHFDGRLKDGSLYVGWVDAKSSEPVEDKDVRSRYEKDILAHSGVRLVGE